MKIGLKQVISAGVVLVVIAGGWALWENSREPVLPEDLAAGNGRLEAVQVDVSTRIAGRVEEVQAREGDLVQPGQIIATIDTRQLQAQLLQTEANVASAESQVASAHAVIAQAKAKMTLARQELARSSELVKRGFTSKENDDASISNVAVAAANLAAAEANLVSQERAVDAARAQVVQVQAQVDDATLHSPTIGRVLYRLAEPGEVLGSGGKVLTLINLADVYMELYLPSSQVTRIAIGAEARVKLDVVDVVIPATVTFVSPESQFTPKQVETDSERDKLVFRVKVRVPQELVLQYIDEVKTGIRGVAYVRLTPLPGEEAADWPLFLQNLPEGYTPSETAGDSATVTASQ